MELITYETANRNPEVIEALIAQARRERAAAVHRLLLQPIKRLFARHATRSHLGHPRKAGGAAA
jgi:hypothetical protein